MFPIPWNFPFRKKDGSLSTIDAEISAGGGGGGGYVLPTASDSTKGGIKIGSGLTMSGEVLNNDNPTPYSLPTASSEVLGGVKVGTGLTITDGVLSNNNPTPPTPYELPTASANTLGGVKVGTGLTITDGVLSNNNPTPPTPYELPTASANTLGGVKVGSGLSIDANGVLSASGGGGGSSRYLHRIVINCNWSVGTSSYTGTVTFDVVLDSSDTSYTQQIMSNSMTVQNLFTYLINEGFILGASKTIKYPANGLLYDMGSMEATNIYEMTLTTDSNGAIQAINLNYNITITQKQFNVVDSIIEDFAMEL